MNLYISDLHFGHQGIIAFDNRPFADALTEHGISTAIFTAEKTKYTNL